MNLRRKIKDGGRIKNDTAANRISQDKQKDEKLREKMFATNLSRRMKWQIKNRNSKKERRWKNERTTVCEILSRKTVLTDKEQKLQKRKKAIKWKNNNLKNSAEKILIKRKRRWKIKE